MSKIVSYSLILFNISVFNQSPSAFIYKSSNVGMAFLRAFRVCLLSCRNFYDQSGPGLLLWTQGRRVCTLRVLCSCSRCSGPIHLDSRGPAANCLCSLRSAVASSWTSHGVIWSKALPAGRVAWGGQGWQVWGGERPLRGTGLYGPQAGKHTARQVLMTGRGPSWVPVCSCLHNERQLLSSGLTGALAPVYSRLMCCYKNIMVLTSFLRCHLVFTPF